jgi:hypothetical protein
MIKYGSAITPEQRSIPKRTFAVMGGLDATAGILQVFAATYLGGSLIILLGQAAIPVSMAISSVLLKTRYSIFQYVGAIVVTIGLIVVLGPGVGSSGGSDSHAIVAWSLVMILSCVPMCLSSVYKEKALGETELDVVYLNGWVAVFQFMASIPLTVPAAKIGDPPVSPGHIFQNLHDGFRCYLGHNTIMDGPHKDKCEMATLYVSAYIVFNVVYNLLIIFILKFGSANILWLVRPRSGSVIGERYTHVGLIVGDDDHGAPWQRCVHVSIYARAPASSCKGHLGSRPHHGRTFHIPLFGRSLGIVACEAGACKSIGPFNQRAQEVADLV